MAGTRKRSEFAGNGTPTPSNPTGCWDITYNQSAPASLCNGSAAGNMTANPGNNPGPAIFIARTYRNAIGSDKASNKSNLIYVGTCGIGVVSGYFIANAGKKKRVVLGMGIGLGLGIGAGLLANSLMK